MDTDKIILTIEDNGIGIIDKDIDKVFDNVKNIISNLLNDFGK